ncbi:hypothetical protein RRF57_012843 [Xylaria bambusicola]|uniref:Uncharacterized protein n=1 Tax=Xylaria bambusicola TaxID=326684 RepID=A0AAN7ZDX2_9PEZI
MVVGGYRRPCTICVHRQRYNAVTATVADVSVDLVVPTAQFGSVRGGVLVLESQMCLVTDCVRLPLGHRIMDDWKYKEFLANVAEGIEFFPDTREDGLAIEAIFMGTEPDRPLFLINLWWADCTAIELKITALGLVVAPSDGIQETFTRVSHREK